MNKSYVSLHTHTIYSSLDGYSEIPALVTRAKEYNMPALAITDHGNCAGWLEFYNETQKQEIKPIFGCELYMVDDLSATFESTGKRKTLLKDRNNYHLTLLAKNKTGYDNIIKLSSIAATEGFYYKPRVDWSLLEKHSEGIIALSACLGGYIQQTLLRGKRDGLSTEEITKRSIELIERYQNIFDGNFYLEVQDNHVPDQYVVNDFFSLMSKETKAPLVGTLDAHYVDKEDAYYHDILICIQIRKFYDEQDRMMYGEWSDEGEPIYHPEYLRSPEEFYKSQEEQGWDNALENTLKIAEECSVKLDFKISMPDIEIPEEHGSSDEKYLESLAKKGFLEKGLNKKKNAQEYKERLLYELDVIKNSGYSSYFIIIWDYMRECRKRGAYFGFGRGSAAGSLVVYCLGITDVDPIEFNLLFERFLNPDRVSLPDIDTDVSDRDLVVRYLTEKYGVEKVAAICNYSRIKSKQALQDVCRVLRVDYSDSIKMSKSIPEGYDINDIEEDWKMMDPILLDSPDPMIREAAKLKQDEMKRYMAMFEYWQQYPKVFHAAARITGAIRGFSTHAAGIVIAPGPLTDFCPLMKDKSGNVQTQWDMNGVEQCGLVKLDNLGLKTLSVVQTTVQLIEKTQGKKIDPFQIDREDSVVLKSIHEENPFGLFQVEASGAQKLSKAIDYSGIDEIGIALALNRPGPLDSGITQQYIDRHTGKKMPTPIHPEIDIFEEANLKLIIFQEDIMQLARYFGFTGGEADTLRKGIGKKKVDLLNKMKPKFINGAIAKGLTDEEAESLWAKIFAFGAYAFNKCIPGTSLILTSEGNKELINLKPGDTLFSKTKDDLIIPNILEEIIDTGEQEVYEVEFENGIKQQTTLDHKFLCSDNKMHILRDIIDNDLEVVLNEEKMD